MANELSGRKVAILAADGVERVELEQPRSALTGAPRGPHRRSCRVLKAVVSGGRARHP